MKILKLVPIVCLICFFFSAVENVSAQKVDKSAITVPDVDKTIAPDLIKEALQVQNLVIETTDPATQDLLSSHFEWKPFHTYRARYRFHIQENAVIVSLDDIEISHSGQWTVATDVPSFYKKDLIKKVAEPIKKAQATYANRKLGRQDVAGIENTASQRTTSTSARTPSTDKALSYEMYSLPDGCYCSDGLCPIMINPTHWVFVDRAGKQAFPGSIPQTGCPAFSEGLAVIHLGSGDVGFIDKKGMQQFKNHTFKAASPFHNGLSVVTVDTGQMINGREIYRNSLMDRQGKLTKVSPEAEGWVSPQSEFSEGLTSVWNPAKFRVLYVNTSGQLVFSKPGQQSKPFSDGLSWLLGPSGGEGSDSRWGAIDAKGSVIVPFMYQYEPGNFSDGMAAVTDRNFRLGFIDKTNTLRIQPQFSAVVSPFHEGHAIVVKNSRNVLIDKTGAVIKEIPTLNQTTYNCGRKDNLCSFAGASSVGLGDTEGNVLIPSRYFQYIGEFRDGLDGLAWAKVELSGKVLEGYINAKGNFVVIKGETQF